MPQSAHAFVDWANNFVTVAAAHAAAWGFEAAQVQALGDKNTALEQLILHAAEDAASSEDVRAKNTALREARALFKDFVNEKVRYNHLIDNDGRAALGTHVHDDTRTDNPVPTDRVAFTIRPTNSRELRNDFFNEQTGKKAIGWKLSGAVQARQILEAGEAAPTDPAHFPLHAMLTSSPHIDDDYREEDRGKRVAYGMCWQNTKGEKGPWSDVQVHVVP
jgi:hypothetical protein